jgi:hypothetical protein
MIDEFRRKNADYLDWDASATRSPQSLPQQPHGRERRKVEAARRRHRRRVNTTELKLAA